MHVEKNTKKNYYIVVTIYILIIWESCQRSIWQIDIFLKKQNAMENGKNILMLYCLQSEIIFKEQIVEWVINTFQSF